MEADLKKRLLNLEKRISNNERAIKQLKTLVGKLIKEMKRK